MTHEIRSLDSGDQSNHGTEQETTRAGLVLDGLAQLSERAMLDDCALGSALGRCDRSIRRMVDRGELPPGISVGGRTVWIVGRVIAWLVARAEREELESERRRAKLHRLDP